MGQVSHHEVGRFSRTPEVEVLKLWAFAITLALGAGGIYVAGLSVMFALGAGQ
jgi:hypothetical protein